MAKIAYIENISSNNIPYIRFGNGKKQMLVFYGGPGDILPRGMLFSVFAKGFFPFKEEYTITMLSRKIGLREGYTTELMAQDYATLIENDFNNKVDVIIGYSYGGIIAQHFAAMYPNLFDYLIILGATNKPTEKGLELDRRFSKYLSEGKKAKAFSIMGEIFSNSKIKKALIKFALFLTSFFVKIPKYDTFSEDILIEFEAEGTHDASDHFALIKKPILIIIGDEDYYFTVESAKSMAEQIPNSILKIYRDTGHNLEEHPNFERDLREFIGKI
ncbi:MAG: alpha/beta hydrolase [Candidatus Lokiarchaeota archaeon]|nr:alpha/beta hydrolase [Candidatus Harpocratesius repetitus]